MEKKRRFWIFIAGVILCVFQGFGPAPAFGQAETRRQVVERYLIPSYITFGGGYNAAQPRGGYHDYWFEGDINQHFHISLGENIFLKFNPRVRVRMLALESNPVLTPSFMPNLTLFFGMGTGERPYEEREFTYYSIMLSHHSNGQAGEFYNPDGSINLETGSFSTNFIDFGINRIWGEGWFWQAWTRLSLIWHPGFNRTDELDDQYERLKVALATSTIRGLPPLSRYQTEFTATLSYDAAGRNYTFIPGPGSALSPKKAQWYDRINWGGTVSFGARRWGDLRGFISYEHGYDTYNIHFFERVQWIKIGLMGDQY